MNLTVTKPEKQSKQLHDCRTLAYDALLQGYDIPKRQAHDACPNSKAMPMMPPAKRQAHNAAHSNAVEKGSSELKRLSEL